MRRGGLIYVCSPDVYGCVVGVGVVNTNGSVRSGAPERSSSSCIVGVVSECGSRRDEAVMKIFLFCFEIALALLTRAVETNVPRRSIMI